MRKPWLFIAICLSLFIFVGCGSDTATTATDSPAQLPTQPTSGQAVQPTDSPGLSATAVPTTQPTTTPTEEPTATPAEGVITGQVVDALARNDTEIDLLQVEDAEGRIWQFITDGPIGVDAAHLLVHRDTNEGVEVVYETKAGRFFALQVNDLPEPIPTPTLGPTPVKVANAIIGDPGYLIGDGKVSSSPVKGSVFACSQEFRSAANLHTGDWVVGAYWYPARKLTVQGEVEWPDAQVGHGQVGGNRLITGNALPLGHPTGIFPIRLNDPAYQIDRNPNAISSHSVDLELPLNPTLAATPSCVPMGMVGIALNGVAVYNALDDAGLDAVAHEVQDLCGGHPQGSGEYHYHGPGACQIEAHTLAHTLAGYAMDGFGLFGLYDDQGEEITNANLDECHGHTHSIEWDGAESGMYHYHLTNAYPYTVSCYRGSVVVQSRPNLPGGGLPPPRH